MERVERIERGDAAGQPACPRTGRRVAPTGRGVAGRLARATFALGLSGLVAGLTAAVPSGGAGAATTIGSNKSYAQAQLLRLSDMPHGWTKSGSDWVGTSADQNSPSLFTMTQFPQFSTCLGKAAPLSVVAAEASTPDYYSKDGNTDVFDVADVYSSVSQAKSDLPPFNDPKLASCFVNVEGPFITSVDQSSWPTGSSFGTPRATVSRFARYGEQSEMLEVQTPVTLPQGQGTSNDFLVAVVIRQGRSVAELVIDQGDTPASAELTASLAKTITARMTMPPPRNSVVAA